MTKIVISGDNKRQVAEIIRTLGLNASVVIEEPVRKNLSFSGNIMISYFNELHEGGLPVVEKLFKTLTDYLYEEKILLQKPTKVEAYIRRTKGIDEFQIGHKKFYIGYTFRK